MFALKKKIRIQYDAGRTEEREINYIPLRYILALLLAVLETVAVITVLVLFGKYIPYFYLAMWATEIGCVIHIIACDEAPDYKIPWLLVVLIVPVAGFMLYFMFGNRTLQRKFIRRLEAMRKQTYPAQTEELAQNIAAENPAVSMDAKMLCKIADTNLFTNTTQQYFPLGEDMHKQLLVDLRTAEKFIFMDYFIIEEGIFWNSILDILKEKAVAGVEVRVIYDDIGCMMTLPGNYDKILKDFGIDAVPFSRLKGNADSEFNNRSHRKITVIDGIIGYTGGVNIADEYINEKVVYGHWKDVGLRLEGEDVRELTKLFLTDYGINVKKFPEAKQDYFPEYSVPAEGYLMSNIKIKIIGGNENVFVTWDMLATYAGALAMVLIVTQFTKNLSFIAKIPTQVWSYIVALLVLYPANYFIGALTIETAVLILFNGIIVALAAYGGFEALSKAFPGLFKSSGNQ